MNHEKMGHREDPAQLGALLSKIVDSDPSVAVTARQAARQLFLRTPLRDLIGLEQQVRQGSRLDGYYSFHGTSAAWRRLDGVGLLRMSSEEGGAFVVRLASFHPSGYVREQAVRLLDEDKSGGELPFLLLRVNDWVSVLQKRARNAVESRLLAEHAWMFLHSHFLVQNLVAQRRNELGSLHRRISDFLRSRAAEKARDAALTDADRHVRRAAFVLSSEAEAVDLRALLLRGLASDDLWLRLFAARTARNRLYGPALREALGQARGDRSTPVRREALLGFADEHPELRQSLLDPSASLREMVRFYLRKKANLDFAEIYRQALSQSGAAAESHGSRQLQTAIEGLGETGSAKDADAIEMFTIDMRPRIRRAALIALGRLDGDNRIATLGAALSDESPNVARAALKALGPRLSLVGQEGLERAYAEQSDRRCQDAIAATLAVLRK